MFMKRILVLFILSFLPVLSFASNSTPLLNLHMAFEPIAILALTLFAVAYLFVMTEEFSNSRKSKPVVLVAGIIWLIVGYVAKQKGLDEKASMTVKHNILEFAELFMFLLVAMTYVNAMEERLVFESLRSWLVRKGFSYRQLFWVTGMMAFVISPIADNLTTALLMCAVVMAVGVDNPKFVGLACINIVVAANAGGAFSPFGDITTLMVWQKNKLALNEFFHIFLPSVISFVIPAICMHFAIPNIQPEGKNENVQMKIRAKRVLILFFLTIITAVSFHNFFHLPPMLGMMAGLGYLNFFAYYLKKSKDDGNINFHNESSHNEIVPQIFSQKSVVGFFLQ